MNYFALESVTTNLNDKSENVPPCIDRNHDSSLITTAEVTTKAVPLALTMREKDD